MEREPHDLIPFIVPSDKRIVELAYHIDGSQGTQRIQVQPHPSLKDSWLVVKGKEWESIYLHNNYILRDIDTSEAQDRFYCLKTGDKWGAIWCRRFMLG